MVAKLFDYAKNHCLYTLRRVNLMCEFSLHKAVIKHTHREKLSSPVGFLCTKKYDYNQIRFCMNF
jgi:hypothetical protein